MANNPQVPRIVYTPDEAGQALGVSRQSIYNLMYRGELLSVQIGRSRRIPASEIERLAAHGSGPLR
jgi:excisionase family DNA binding protein